MNKINQSSKVMIEFELGTEDEIFDAAPAELNHWISMNDPKLLPGIRVALLDRSEGDSIDKWLDPSLTFGEPDPELKITVSLQKLPAQIAKLEVGDRFDGKGPKGKPAVFRVTAKNEKNMTMDANHPLAGQPLQFVAKILKIE